MCSFKRKCVSDFAGSLCNTRQPPALSQVLLQAEMKSFSFQFEYGCYDAKDVASQQWNKKMPGNWYAFMNHLCGQRVNSDAFDRKSHVIFQIVYYLLHNGSKKNSTTCQHCTRCIHNECRSKTLITILNRLGLCISNLKESITHQ